MSKSVPLTILYGSQTGSAKEVSFFIAREGERRNFSSSYHGPTALDAYDWTYLPDETLIIFVIATTGDGDPPDNMKRFWRFLLRKDIPNNSLEKINFAVFGLGDSSYTRYNVMAIKFRRRLLQLGAKETVKIGFGDDQSPYGLEGDLDKWLGQTLWPELLLLYPLPEGYVIDYSPKLFKAIHDSIKVEERPTGNESSIPENYDREAVISKLRPLMCYESKPLRAKVQVNHRITHPLWEQDVRHLELKIENPECPLYLPGDIAVVYSSNILSDNQFESFCKQMDIHADSIISGLRLPHTPAELSVRALFTYYLDILGTPHRQFFESLSFFAKDPEEKEKLEEICSSNGIDIYHTYCRKERKTYIEIFLDFPSTKVPINYLVELIPKLEPREYSISSSSKVHGHNMIHLTVAIIMYKTPWGRIKSGVASAWFQKLEIGSSLLLYIKRGVFRIPTNPDTPLVLIGPGTGIAPLRGIIYERSSSSNHLYFGCRSKSNDYYYESEWKTLLVLGKLGSIRVAFSREIKGKKVYVQTLLVEDKEKLYNLLVEQDGYCFISGSASSMPNDVRKSIINILTDKFNSNEKALSFVRKMELNGKLKIEAWN